MTKNNLKIPYLSKIRIFLKIISRIKNLNKKENKIDCTSILIQTIKKMNNKVIHT